MQPNVAEGVLTSGIDANEPQGSTRQKMAFLSSEVSKILIPIARKTSPPEDKVTEDKVESCIASILKGAPARKAAKV